MFVAGVDGCRAGWVCFKIELSSLATSVETFDLAGVLKNRPSGLSYLAIDIPIGLLSSARGCDLAARKLLGSPRASSVFSAPCREALSACNHAESNAINRHRTGRGLSQQAWGICRKIKEVDDAIAPQTQQWTFEVHPEVSFWALNHFHPMRHNKKNESGRAERRALLMPIFPKIDSHLLNRPSGIGADDLLDAAVAAWTALRRYKGEAERVCPVETDERGLDVTIWY